MKLPIYLDNASTTPTDPRVVTKMQECLSLESEMNSLPDWCRERSSKAVTAYLPLVVSLIISLFYNPD